MLYKYRQFFDQNVDKSILVIYGGAGAGKSYSVAQYLIARAVNERRKRILCTRKTLPSLRMSCYTLMMDLIRQAGIPVVVNRSELTLTFPTSGSTIYFKSLDDPQKIKSAEFNYIWAEEATELNHEDFLQLVLRLRRRNEMKNQLYLTFNPVDAYHWLKTKLVDCPSPELAVLHTTYKDNHHLSEDYIRELERLAELDENYHRIYALGEWGILQNLIYTNWDVVDEFPEAGEILYGLDFGYNNPTALVEVRLKESEAWVREVIYRSHLTNQDLIELMKQLSISGPIYADSSEPQRIEELYRAGFNVCPADKSVKDGIDKVKRLKLHIAADSVNLLKEIRGYKWREDKNGRVIDEPVKFNDHAVDALRYAIASMAGNVTPQAFIL